MDLAYAWMPSYNWTVYVLNYCSTEQYHPFYMKRPFSGCIPAHQQIFAYFKIGVCTEGLDNVLNVSVGLLSLFRII